MRKKDKSAKKIAEAMEAERPAYRLRGRPRKEDVGSWERERGRRTTIEFQYTQFDRIGELSWDNRITFKEAVYRLMAYGIRECERLGGDLSLPADGSARYEGQGRKTMMVFDETQYDRAYDYSCANHITRKEAVYRLLRLGIRECERRGGVLESEKRK